MKKVCSLLTAWLLLGVLFMGCAAPAPSEETVPTASAVPGTASPTPAATPLEPEDYAASVQPAGSGTAVSQTVTVHTFIDGDTVHFNVPESVNETGVLKARFLAVNTPESTGRVEEYGKAAAAFTKERLQQAASILVESDTGQWNIDSTGGRYLVWVWYKPQGSAGYRNLNIELLQEGLAQPYSAANNRYGSVCTQALNQAKALKLKLYSGQKDPDYYYGDAVELTLRELRCHLAEYDGMKVAFEGNIIANRGNSVYIEEPDAESGQVFGITAYYGFSLSGTGMSILSVGNRARIVGTVQYYEAGGTYQISGLSYREIQPDDPNNLQKLGDGVSALYTPMTAGELAFGSVALTLESGEMTLPAAQLRLDTSVSMTGLLVEQVQLPDPKGESTAVTLYCTQEGTPVTLRLEKAGEGMDPSGLTGKRIDVKGLVDCFAGSYQIRILSNQGIIIEN